MHIKPLAAATLFTIALGCGGSGGSSLGNPPVVTEVTPLIGSARTRWTIRGSGFSSSSAADQVFFNGHLATVVTASNDLLVVTDAFPAVALAQPMAVSVVVADEVSPAFEVTAAPSGTIVEATPATHSFGRISSFVEQPGRLLIADPEVGLLSIDDATHLVTPLVLNGQTGLGSVADVYSDGTRVYLVDQSGGIWILGASGSATLLTSFGQPVQALAFDALGNVYVAVSTTVAKIDSNGSRDPLFTDPALVNPIARGGLTYLAGQLYGSIPAVPKLVRVDAGTGAAADFVTTGLAGPAALTSDSSGLWLADGVALKTVSTGAVIATFSTMPLTPGGLFPQWSSVVSLARVGTRTLFSAAGSSVLFELDSPTAGVVRAAGLSQISALGRAATGEIVAMGSPSQSADCWLGATGFAGLGGAVWLFGSDESARTLTVPFCPFGAASTSSRTYLAGLVPAPGSATTVDTLDTSTGQTTPLLIDTAGLSVLATDAAGNLYLGGATDRGGSPLHAVIDRLSPAGLLTEDFVSDALPGSQYTGSAVVGSALFFIRSPLNGPYSLDSIPLSGGTPTTLAPFSSATPRSGIAEDPLGGGLYLEEGAATVVRYDLGTGQESPFLQTGATTTAGLIGDPTDGSLLVGLLGAPAFERALP